MTGQVSPGGRRPWHVLDLAEVESRLGTSARGLARVEAAARLERHGLRVEPLDPGTWVRMALIASTILVAVEIDKSLRRRPSRAMVR